MPTDQYFEGVSFSQDIQTRQKHRPNTPHLITYRSFNPDVEEVTFDQNVIFMHRQGVADIRCYYDGREQRGAIVPGNICLVAAGQSFGSAPEDRKEDHGLSSSALFLPAEPLRRFVEQTLERDPTTATLRPLFLEQDVYVTETTQILKRLSTDSSAQLYRETILQGLYAYLLYRYGVNPVISSTMSNTRLSPRRLNAVEEYVQTHYAQNISLQQLADLVHLSPYYFARLFKNATGMSPHNYLLQVRIDRAKELLAQEEVNLYKIAVELGFTDQSHFGRHFKKVVGITPRQYHLVKRSGG